MLWAFPPAITANIYHMENTLSWDFSRKEAEIYCLFYTDRAGL